MVNNDKLVSIVDSVDWLALQDAYGTAKTAGNNFKKLLSDNEDDREDAFHALCGTIYHQGTRYGASAPAVNVLCAFVASPTTPDRVRLTWLITHLAIGDPTHRWMKGIAAKEWREEVAEMLAPDFGEKTLAERSAWVAESADEKERQYRERRLIFLLSPEEMIRRQTDALAAYDAVKAQLPTLFALLNDPDPAVRIEAVFAMSWFPEAVEAVGEQLLNRLYVEQDDVVRATMLISLGQLGMHGAQEYVQTTFVPRVEVAFSERNVNPLVRWSAAIGMIQLGSNGPVYVDEVSRKMFEADYLEDVIDPDIHTNGFPFADPDLNSLAAMVLGNLKDEEAIAKNTEGLITKIPDAKGEPAVVLTQMALQATFPLSTEKVKAEDLTPIQLRLVRAITKVDRWLFSFVNFTTLLPPRGLPFGRRDLCLLAGEDPDAGEPTT